jgi:transmembrane sensor
MNKKLPWDLIVSKLRKELSTQEELLFSEWLSKGDNTKLFQQLKFVWERVQQKVYLYEPDLEYYWNELSSRIQANPVEKSPSTTPIHKFLSNRFLRIAATVAIIISTTFFVFNYVRNNSNTSQEYITYSTLRAKSKVLLPDSTVVWLNTNSSITYNFNKKLEQREVNLSGEAYFNVKHDVDKAFLVDANGIQIKVHGTQFNVNSYVSSNNVLISLYKGSVSLKTEDKDVFLKPGEEGLFDVKSKNISVSVGDVEFAKIWTSDKIRFENKNLREVCRYLSKWYGIKMEIDTAINNKQSYTFTFRGQSLEEVVSIMASIQSFNYKIDEEKNIVTIKK